MEDSTYIFFFSVDAEGAAEPLFARMKQLHPGLVLKHRPEPGRPFHYSVQFERPGARFGDEDLEVLYPFVREAGGSVTGSRIFYEDEDFA